MNPSDHQEAAPRVVVALGSNLGDSVALLRKAMLRLGAWSEGRPDCSSLWRTSPVDCPPGSPPFVNGVVLLRPLRGETPETMLDRLQGLEREFGRRPKSVLNEARPLDLDLIVWGDEIRETARLTLPHPRALQREFVLRPLAQIAPDLMFPRIGKTVASLLENLSTGEALERLDQ
jgi:2-amino-4-hydroxy-6-hydroxymethyldihydropteridine diphosphokinase